MRLASATRVTSSSALSKSPSPPEIPAIPEATPTEKGFTVDARQPTCVPMTTIMNSWLLTQSATERRTHHVPRFTCPSKLSVSDETFNWLASIS
jgi:hypothetical protein